MKFIFSLILLTIWGIIVKGYAAPLKPSTVEYGFWSGLLHGFSWFVLLIQKWFGAAICVYADFHTSGYIVGFVMGCFFGTIVVLRLLLTTLSN
jgi:hypothetical protein